MQRQRLETWFGHQQDQASIDMIWDLQRPLVSEPEFERQRAKSELLPLSVLPQRKLRRRLVATL